MSGMFVLSIIGLVMSAAATAYGIVASQQAAAKQAELQERQAKAQAASLRNQAEQEEQDQLQRSMIARRQNARKLAAAESQYAASGVTLAGTPTLSLARMSEENEMDVLMQEASSGRKRQLLLAEAYNTEQFGYASADLTRSSATAEAIGSGLNGIGDLGDKLYSFGKDEGYIGQKRK